MRGDVKARFNVWKEQIPNLKYEEFSIHNPKTFSDFFCVECALDHNDYAFIIGYPNEQTSYQYNPPTKWNRPTLDQCTICYIASENEPYKTFFNENVKEQSFIKHAVAYYGNDEIKIKNYERMEMPIDMARARNVSINKAKTDYLFTLDVDTVGTQCVYEGLLDMYSTFLHHGIVNMRCDDEYSPYKMGNSFYFGPRNIFEQNYWNEDFKSFYFEDTEYMINWGRIGFPVINIDVNLKKKNHKKVVNEFYNNQNKNLFAKILKRGRTNEN